MTDNLIQRMMFAVEWLEQPPPLSNQPPGNPLSVILREAMAEIADWKASSEAYRLDADAYCAIREDEMSDIHGTREELVAEIVRLQDAKRAALAIADERSRENVALRAALKPFASIALWRDRYPDSRTNMIDGPDICITAKQVMAARDALAPVAGEEK